MSGITNKLNEKLKKIHNSNYYDEFCEILGRNIYQMMHDEEITDFESGDSIAEALITNDADKVFGAFTGMSAEEFLEKHLLIPNESEKYYDEICEAEYVSVWDDGIELRSECKVDTKKRLVFDIEDSGINPDSVENLEEEYIDIDGIRMPVHKSDEVDKDDIFPFRYEG